MRRRPKERRTSLGHLLTDRSGLIFIGVDLFGPIYHNKKKYCILTIIDHFTLFAEGVVTTLIDAQTIWTLLYIRWISVWGPPPYILSDNDPQFITDEFRKNCNNLRIYKIFSTTYHPGGNSVAESFHQFLKRSTSAMLPYSNFSLAEIVATVLQAYRTTPHPETEETPLLLLTGQDSMLPHWQEWEAITLDNWKANTRLHMLTRIRVNALQHMIKKIVWRDAKSKNIRGHPQYKVGDLVICWLRRMKSKICLNVSGTPK